MQTMLAIFLVLFTTNYASLTSRDIKALSDEDVAALRDGKGMGLALAAELNGFPGPKHALELADKLSLTDVQRSTIQKSHDKMLAQALTLGAEIVALEKQLDQAFASTSIDQKRLEELTSAIGMRQGNLRRVHLAAHLETRAALTPDQIRRYAEARGYKSGQAHGHHHGH